MKNIILFALLGTACLIGSCSNGAKKTLTHDSISINNAKKLIEKQSKDTTVYLRATGTEPFWGLEISAQQLVLNLIEDSIVTVTPEPITEVDSNIKTYRVKTEDLTLMVQIIQKDCENGMSGMVSPYTINIKYKRKTDTTTQELNGCGNYVEESTETN